MFVDFKLDDAYQGPIYKQIAERISDAIQEGKLAAGFKLPTVRELSGEIGVACGTIKHAYEYLEEQGFVEMVQGSGSFVVDQKEDSASRKEKAMTAIDELFARLESLGFTPREMEIYLNLKLRGLEEKYDVVKVALVDCNPETLQMIEGQLSQIGYAETAAFDLARIEEAEEDVYKRQGKGRCAGHGDQPRRVCLLGRCLFSKGKVAFAFAVWSYEAKAGCSWSLSGAGNRAFYYAGQ